MTDDGDGARDDTLVAPPASDDKATRPSAPGGMFPRPAESEQAPQVALGSAVVDTGQVTRPSDPVMAAEDSGARRERVRAGRPEDYPTLVPVDPAHYVRSEEIARGGMGRIVAAHDRRLGREVAIKELLAPSDALRARFEREARITARLQHPSTIGVLEAGTWPTGDLFYAMNLVAGKSLDKVIAARPSAEARFGLIAHVIAVADTIAYAHNLRIIHRDLKPANVLIGDYGETVVIDWGLAKDLADPSSVPDVSIGPYRGAATDTEVGSVIGTPAYMPPEQAAGDPVDERADVYALGAMLYHVLTGAPPFAGRTGEAVLAAVTAGPPPPILEVAPATPPDLATIVQTAMARAPLDRYPSAKELAAELRNFQTGQLVGSHHYTTGQLFRRWLRRHRTAVAVALVATVVLAGVGVVSVQRIVRERERAEAQRTLAVARGADAQELMTFMLGEMREKLTPVGKLDLLDTVARKAVAYYEQRPEDESDADRGKRAGALRNIGEVLVLREDFARALSAYRQAEVIEQGLVVTDPTNITWQIGLASTHSQLGAVYATQGDLKATTAELQIALAGLEAVTARAPDNREALLTLVTTHRQLGDTLIDAGDGSGAAAQFRAALAIAAAQVAATPTDLRWQRALAIAHSQLGGLLLLQGDQDGALREHREDVRISEAIAAVDPTNTEAVNDVAGSHSRIGDVLRAKGDNAGALVEFRASLATMKRLTDRDPTNGDWQHDRSISHDRVGNVLLDLGDRPGALAEYREGVELKQRLVERDPTNRNARRDVAIGHNKVGSVMEASGKRAEALAEYSKGLGILEALTGEDTSNAGWQRDLAVSHYLIADMQLATGKPEEALVSHRAALAIVEKLTVRDPTNAIWQGDVIESHTAVANVLLALHQPAAALPELETALALAEHQAAKDPTNTAWTEQATKLRATIKTCCALSRQ